MTSIEKEATKAFQELLGALSSPMNEKRLGMIESFLHPRCTGFGTAHQEIFRNRDDWLSILFAEEPRQIPNGIKVTPSWCETCLLDSSTVVLMAETVFRIKLPKGKTIAFDPIRMGIVYVPVDGKMLVTHWHVSYPLGEAHDEIFPGSREPKLYEEVSVLFTDFAGFSHVVSTVPPKKLLSELNELFGQFDEISEAHGLTKVKTIGDAYMAVAGLDERHSAGHAVNAVAAARDMLAFAADRNRDSAMKWNLRVGIHSGSVVGGVVGRNKLQFDVWGDTVNIASRLESTSEPGRINISAYTYELVKDRFQADYRGRIHVKGKGEIDMYFIKDA